MKPRRFAKPPAADLARKSADAREPLRGELFSIDHLRTHAVHLAHALTVAPRPVVDHRFQRQFQRNARYLRAANAFIAQAIRNGEPLTPDVEWLLDNFYLVEEHLHEIQNDLPPAYFRELPKLADGQPRTFQFAVELIIHTDSVVQQDDLTAFVNEFQDHAPFSIGELWALPIMLRLALVENLCRLAAQMVANLTGRAAIKDALSGWDIGGPLPDALQANEPRPDVIAHAFTVTAGLFPDDPARASALEHELAERFPASTELIRAEHRRQAANQVSIGNVITSMRLISALDWTTFFEKTSLTEKALRTDPACVYSLMDPETRDRYRHAVEDLARQSRQTELSVTDRALVRARQAFESAGSPTMQSHVGYWLIDDGRRTLERELGYRPKFKQRIPRWMRAHPQTTYFGLMTGVLGWCLLILLWLADQTGLSWPATVLLIAAAAWPLSEFAVSLVNLLITRLLSPRLLPKLELKAGIPSQWRAIVVVPAMLTGRKEIAALLNRLEMHFVSNPEQELRFALLSDFTDAATEHLETDAALVEQAVAGIRRLNASHGGGNRQPFYLFHRARRWNDREQVWMGWERKRGKLMEFNRLLHGARDTSYLVQEGDLDFLMDSGDGPPCPFVITLDADTQLPLGTARRMVGTLAHPLNRPLLDDQGRGVIHGYSILQPRVSVQLEDGNKSRFTRLFANGKGLDPYATAASDVYQDLFGEGSFTGKGIYDVQTFERTLEGAFGENQILSHDLIEGCHARVALLSDVEVIDGYPARYDAEARRNHRWARGDWQLLPWLFRRVPCTQGKRPSPLSALSRWKIFDNLRRSLVAPFTCLFLVATWFLTPDFAALWSAAAWACLAWPLAASLANSLLGFPRPQYWAAHLRAGGADLVHALFQTLVLISCLPHKAVLMLDAIARTLVRLGVTRRRMLEWETAAATERRLAKSRWSVYREMAFVPISVAIIAFLIPTAAWPAAAPWLLAWLLSPWIADTISQPIVRRREVLSADDQQWLRLVARDTWSYFETFVGPRTNWLPPDNFQEYPEDKLAERISPTNEGLFLVSALVARDLGFLGLHALLDLWEKNLNVWRQLPQLHGHAYNWYETSTLQPLKPRYVLTVDSGNLAASLLVVRQGAEDVCRSGVFGDAVWTGLRDTVAAAMRSCEELQPRNARLLSPPLDDLTAGLGRLGQALESSPKTWGERLAGLRLLQAAKVELNSLLTGLMDSHRHPSQSVEAKVRSLLVWIEGCENDFARFVPWIDDYSALRNHLANGPLPDRLREAWQRLQQKTEGDLSVEQLSRLPDELVEELAALSGVPEANGPLLEALRTGLRRGAAAAQEFAARCQAVGHLAEQMALGMNFEFLFNPQRRLFAIGYNLEDGCLDRSHYDMLCSEARLSSHLAIAKGDVAYKHWFQLGRQLTFTVGQPGLLSWGGTMFEFLMPLLFQRRYVDSLLSQACEAAVARQQEYGRERGVPWGVSESAYAALAINSDYQYQSFGVPGLGLKRGLSDDLVVAPYAAMLALSIAPTSSVANLRQLSQAGALGRLGFYDAMDYTPIRVPPGRPSLAVRCYMAHHQAMSLAAIANILFDQIIEKRFHAHPLIRATEMLLQEVVPTAAPVIQPHADETTELRAARPEDELVSRRITGFETPAPRTHLLSNGTYSVMVTNTGGGYSRWKELAVNRWRPDGVQDHGGHFLYIRDRRSGQVWSATYQPTGKKPDSYEVIYSIDKAEFRRRDGDIETHLEVVISPDNNVEIRQLKFTNHGWRPCELEVTSYVEVTLTTPAADLAHPAFQKLFVETEYVAEETALIARRRPRENHVPPVWAVHVLACPEVANESVQFESSREAFLGRGRDCHAPAALDPGARLSGTTGLVLDPVFSLRCAVIVGRHASVSLAFATGVAESRDEALRLADEFHEQRSVHRAFELAWVFNQVQLHHLHLTAAETQRFQQLASLLLFPQPLARGPEASLLRNRQGQSGLWRFGISGDRPILLVNVAESEYVDFVRELLLAHEYWRHHGLDVDLVILNTHPGSYLDALQDALQRLAQESRRMTTESKDTVFLLRAAQIAREDQWLLESAAHVVIEARRGWSIVRPQASAAPPLPALAADAKHRLPSPVPAKAAAARGAESQARPTSPPPWGSNGSAGRHSAQPAAESLEFWNGSGGFAADGREYHIQLKAAAKTPMPWSNVIANPRFGTLITEGGGGYSWAGNSRQNKLTSWSNDPITDPPGEILYLRDDESEEVWRPLGYPRQATEVGWAHHGQGYTRFLRTRQDLEQNVLISIAPDDPVKFICVKLHNRGMLDLKLSATYYAELVLGVGREQTQLHLVTEIDPQTGALLIRNAYHPASPDQVAFLRVIGPDRSATGDRTGFLGRNGREQSPAALGNSSLSGKTGAGFDPCGAVQTRFTVRSGETTEIAFLFGCGADAVEAHQLLARYSTLRQVQEAIEQTQARWNTVLTAVQVNTPNRALDLLVNRWLLYQVTSCRLWGRSAFYQSGGAYGFRDQLQDVMALVYSRPDLAREQLIRAAARQYEAGDVQHWWHPPLGEGTRTRFSDDLLWLPFVVAHYVRITGDEAVLHEVIPFLHSHPLAPEEQERYELPQVSAERASLYEHCLRALGHGFQLGEHGLPLMGCGDWNDGMNHVGALGRGESVWVGWFLLVLLDDFLPLIEQRGEHAAAERYREQAVELRAALETHGWDGGWYRRAFFDDGGPLGSRQNDECQIDSIVQSWAVLANADPHRTDLALEAVFDRLVSAESRLVALFTPPFDQTALDPGYIKGYLPGVRENGGQYTHAVLWLIQALTAKGDGARAMKIFDFINPIFHTETASQVRRYRTEPYVIAADVYSMPPHAGRGGWTWYTGSASWAYRTALESILGFEQRGSQVRFQPCVPSDWAEFKVTIRFGTSTWHFTVETQPEAADRLENDDALIAEISPPAPVDLVDDGFEHHQVIRIGKPLASIPSARSL